MKIGVLSYGLPGPDRRGGGFERTAHDVAGELARRGNDVVVWSCDEPPPGALYAVRPLPLAGFVTNPLGRRLTMGYLGNLVMLAPDYGDRDVLVSFGDSLLLPLKGVPFVRIMCGSALGEALSARSPIRAISQTLVYAQEVMSVLTHSSTVAVSDGTRVLHPWIPSTIPLAVDLHQFSPGPARKTAEPSVMFVGTLGGRKRGAKLLEWFARDVLPHYAGATLTMISPPGPPAAGVVYRTDISDEELIRLYRASWVYASPSNYEGLGLPYLEAMACGTPVVATPNPGSRDALGDGRYGLLPADDDFGRALAGLLGDSSLRARLTALGLERARAFDLEKSVQALESLLGTLVRDQEPPRSAAVRARRR